MNIINSNKYMKVLEEYRRTTVLNTGEIENRINRYLKGKTIDDFQWHCAFVDDDGQVFLQYIDPTISPDPIEFDGEQPEESDVYEWINKFSRDNDISLCVYNPTHK